MSLTNNKFIQVNGSPSAGKQPMKDSVFNDELRAFAEYQQIDPQPLLAGIEADITCDGTDISTLKPDGAIGVWNPVANTGDLVNGAFYHIKVIITATPTSNNTTLIIAFVNTSDPLDRFERVLDLPRSGISDTDEADFLFFSTGSTFKITGTATNNTTIDIVTFDEARLY